MTSTGPDLRDLVLGVTFGSIVRASWVCVNDVSTQMQTAYQQMQTTYQQMQTTYQQMQTTYQQMKTTYQQMQTTYQHR